jgi:hypothetical protein
MSKIKFHAHTEPQDKIILLYILVLMFLDSKQEDKRFWSEW